MSLSLLFGIGVIAAALAPRFKRERDFDNKVDYKGINSIPLREIEKRVGARKDKHGMYTHSAMQKLLKYGEEHSHSTKEYQTFAKRINVTMNQQHRVKSEKIANGGIKLLSRKEQDRVNTWIESKGGHEPSDKVEIIRIRRFFTPSNQQEMINDLMTKTWWGKCAVQEPKVIENLNENIELWEMHIPMIQRNICEKNSYEGDMKRLYKKCLKECGHNPKY